MRVGSYERHFSQKKFHQLQAVQCLDTLKSLRMWFHLYTTSGLLLLRVPCERVGWFGVMTLLYHITISSAYGCPWLKLVSHYTKNPWHLVYDFILVKVDRREWKWLWEILHREILDQGMFFIFSHFSKLLSHLLSFGQGMTYLKKLLGVV